jgi:hypothetical protein
MRKVTLCFTSFCFLQWRTGTPKDEAEDIAEEILRLMQHEKHQPEEIVRRT